MQIVGIILSPLSGRLADKYGSRVLCSIGLAINASALFWFSTLNENSSYIAILISLILFGIGRALFISPNTSSIMSSVPGEKRGIANGIRATLTQTGNAISVPFSLLLMSLVIPYDQLSQIVNNTWLINSNELFLFQQAINQACFLLGIITIAAIIPSLLRGSREKAAEKMQES
jgi:MFS family permease